MRAVLLAISDELVALTALLSFLSTCLLSLAARSLARPKPIPP